MSAAAFVLAINLFISGTFATAFAAVAVYQRSSLGARWLAVGYSMGLLNGAFEFVLPYQADHRFASMGIVAAFLVGICCAMIGLARHMRVQPPFVFIGIFLVLSLASHAAILDWPRESLLRGLLYQFPYSVIHLVGPAIIFAAGRRRTLDIVLAVLLVITAVHFLAKPLLAAAIGSGAMPQAYLGSTYAAISQSLGAMMLIANGLVMLLIMVRDAMADMTARSETDTLSQLLNRRGFEERGERSLALAARSGVPAVMVVADLDHFKQINDRFGHATGDQVIAAFSKMMLDCAPPHAISGRLGGEEFAAFLPGANLATGKLFAETVRNAFRTMERDEIGLDQAPTASFGLAQLMPFDSLPDLLRRADTALYQAKSDGRDCVRMAMSDPARPLSAPRRDGRWRDDFSS